jgi:hypothetical protein
VLPNQHAERVLAIVNPGLVEATVVFERFPTAKGFALAFDERFQS